MLPGRLGPGVRRVQAVHGPRNTVRADPGRVSLRGLGPNESEDVHPWLQGPPGHHRPQSPCGNPRQQILGRHLLPTPSTPQGENAPV